MITKQPISEGSLQVYGFVVLAILHSILYIPIYGRLITAWKTMPQCSHGWFILPLALWLVFLKRRYLLGRSYPMAYGGVLVTFIGLVLHPVSMVYESDSLGYLSYIITLMGIIISLFGVTLLRILWFPLAFLVFMFPLPDFFYLRLTGPMKLFASRVSAEILGIAGIPVLQEGNIIQLPNLQLNVVEACSGMQSLVSYIMLGCLLASFLAGPPWKKLVIVGATVPVALLNNILRISGSGFLGEWFGKAAISGLYHELFGLAVFAVGFAILALSFWRLAGSGAGPAFSAGESRPATMGEKCR